MPAAPASALHLWKNVRKNPTYINCVHDLEPWPGFMVAHEMLWLYGFLMIHSGIQGWSQLA